MLQRLSCAVLVVVALVGMVSLTFARTVTVEWAWNAHDATIVQDKNRARQVGFKQAVFEEALALLPGTLGESRQQLLRENLEQRVNDFVLSYSEGRASDTTMALDVRVNRKLLKKTLQGLGVYYTLDTPRPYSLALSGASPEAWEQLGRLQLLTGTTVTSGADPSLELTFRENVWQGTMVAGDQVFVLEHPQLDMLWQDIWKRYFTADATQNSVTSALVLEVSGWYSPDGVEAFDTMLRGWDKSLDSVVITDMTLASQGITGRWNVEVVNRHQLESQLEEYVQGRNLQFHLGEESTGLGMKQVAPAKENTGGDTNMQPEQTEPAPLPHLPSTQSEEVTSADEEPVVLSNM